MKTSTIVILVLVGIPILILGGIGIKILFFPVAALNKGIESGYQIMDKTLEANNVIYNYEWFKRQKEQIDATYKKLAIAQRAATDFEQLAGDRKDWTFEDKTEDARLRAVAQGIESQLKDMIAEYNARSSMATRDIFKDGLIPNTLEFSANLIK